MVFDFTVGKVRSLPLKVRSGTLYARWAWHICQFQRFGKRHRLFPRIKVGPVEIERNGAKRIVKFCSLEFRISRLLH